MGYFATREGCWETNLVNPCGDLQASVMPGASYMGIQGTDSRLVVFEYLFTEDKAWRETIS